MNSENRTRDQKKLPDKLIDVKIGLANYLGRQFNKLSSNAKKLVLVLFGLTAGSACLLLIVQALMGEPMFKAFQKQEVTLPMDIRTPENPKSNQNEFQTIEEYKQWLDSLSVYDRSTYDWIVSKYPDLIDSLDQFLESYEQRSIK